MTHSTPSIHSEVKKHITGDRAFKHSGDAGDVVYSLVTVRIAGGGDFFLARSDFTRVKADESALANLAPLLLAQPYIRSVALHRGEKCAFDLDLFRNVGTAAENICNRHLKAFSFPETEWQMPWLEVEPKHVAPVVINVTPRFRNTKFPWPEVINRYGSNCVFIGHVEEWEAFRKEFYCEINRQHTEDLLQAARVIAGAEIFIGNQSCCLAIAEGLKKTIIQETCPWIPNCLFQRKNFFPVFEGYKELPSIFFNGESPVNTVLDKTPTIPKTCLVQLGRYGDILNILPVAKLIADREGAVSMLVHKQFVDLLDGVSYVQKYVWEDDMMLPHLAAKSLKGIFEKVIVSQAADSKVARERVCESFNMEQWRYAGFLDQWSNLRLEIDQRDLDREKKLVASLGLEGQLFLLVNPESVSSPFPMADQLVAEIQTRWAPRLKVVDMRRFRAEKYYDLLGLLDRAAGLVTVDTATLHLAGASRVPVIALISDHLTPWHGTKPRCNVKLSMRYKEFQFRKEEVHSAINRLLSSGPRRIGRLNLPVTLLGIDPFMPNRTLAALWACMREATFQDVVIVCKPGTKPMTGDWKGVRPVFVDVGPDRGDREALVVGRMHEFITASHCLHVEWDARLANPRAWQDEWLEYDYIGAPWPYPFDQPGFPPCTAENCVGNSGFALISKRFAEAVEKIGKPTPQESRLSDVYMCRTLRPKLEEMGIKFAPESVAELFSCEARYYHGALGWHGRVTAEMNGFKL